MPPALLELVEGIQEASEAALEVIDELLAYTSHSRSPTPTREPSIQCPPLPLQHFRAHP